MSSVHCTDAVTVHRKVVRERRKKERRKERKRKKGRKKKARKECSKEVIKEERKMTNTRKTEIIEEISSVDRPY